MSMNLKIFILAIIILLCTTLTYARNSVWQDSISIWRNAAEGSPRKGRPHENLGFALSSTGHLNEAMAEFQKVMELHDASVPARDVYREIGVVYFRQGRYADAIKKWQDGLKIVPGDYALQHNIQVALQVLKGTKK